MSETTDSWDTFARPAWFPPEFADRLRGSHATPAAWQNAAMRERCCPELGEVVTLPAMAGHEPITGRWIYAWGNIGRLVLPDGSLAVVGVPWPEGPENRVPIVLAGPAADMEDVGESIAITYKFRRDACDWMHATLCDETATLSIASDYGDYVHRWPRESQTLTHSIAWSWDADYMARKLTDRDTRRRYDEGDTEQHVREELITLRRQGDLTKATARILWDGLADIEWGSIDLCVNGLHDLDSECKDGGMFGCEAYEWLVYRPTARYTHLKEVYLPALKARLQSIPSGVQATPLPGSDPDTREWAWDFDGRVSSSTFFSREDAIREELDNDAED